VAQNITAAYKMFQPVAMVLAPVANCFCALDFYSYLCNTLP